MAERQVGHHGPDDREQEAEHDPRAPPGGHVQQAHEQPEEHRRRAQVALEDHDPHGDSQATRIGPRSRPRGMPRPSTLCLTSDSDSRVSTRYEAKKIVRRTLASSAGWKVNGPTWIHRLAPGLSDPGPGPSAAGAGRALPGRSGRCSAAGCDGHARAPAPRRGPEPPRQPARSPAGPQPSPGCRPPWPQPASHRQCPGGRSLRCPERSARQRPGP